MKKLLPIVLLLATGCKQLLPFPLSGPTPSAALASARTNVLVMGQSNAARLGADGYAGFRSIYPQAKFINCAVGGTGLDQWQKNGTLYSNCLVAVGATPIDAIVWIQGENEAEGGACACAIPASTWSRDFTAIARNFQADFKAPIYFSRLGDFDDPSPWWADVRVQQMQTTIGTMVSLDGIAPIPGDRHYTPDGYRQIGARFAAAYHDRGRP